MLNAWIRACFSTEVADRLGVVRNSSRRRTSSTYVEEQAINRAHKFGQKNPVVVHGLLILGTVEDRIMQLQEQRKMLIDAVLGEEGAACISKLNMAELKNLFGL